MYSALSTLNTTTEVIGYSQNPGSRILDELQLSNGLLWKTGAALAKSLARRPGAIVFSSRATKMSHRPARRATLNTGLPCNVPSKLHARGRTLL